MHEYPLRHEASNSRAWVRDSGKFLDVALHLKLYCFPLPWVNPFPGFFVVHCHPCEALENSESRNGSFMLVIALMEVIFSLLG